jgi:hypothetical protein
VPTKKPPSPSFPELAELAEIERIKDEFRAKETLRKEKLAALMSKSEIRKRAEEIYDIKIQTIVDAIAARSSAEPEIQ